MNKKINKFKCFVKKRSHKLAKSNNNKRKSKKVFNNIKYKSEGRKQYKRQTIWTSEWTPSEFQRSFRWKLNRQTVVIRLKQYFTWGKQTT